MLSVTTPTSARPRGFGLCTLSAFWCSDKTFWAFLKDQHGKAVSRSDEAAEFIRGKCGIETRKQLDTNLVAAQKFDTLFRKPYMTWIKAHNSKESA